jgi:hypothetical protein
MIEIKGAGHLTAYDNGGKDRARGRTRPAAGDRGLSRMLGGRRGPRPGAGRSLKSNRHVF